MKKMIKVFITIIDSIAITMVPLIGYAIGYGEELKNSPSKNYSQKFSDISDTYWAKDYISEMVSRNVINGYPNGKFYPDNTITRSEFAKIMTTASGLNISDVSNEIFMDVKKSDWFAPYVHAAYPYLSGYTINGSNYYQPSMPALREDIAVALVKLKGYDIFGYDESILNTMFTDSYSISNDAKPYIAKALETGLISGYDDDTFRGQQGITRAEAATLLWRAYQYGNDNKTFTVKDEPIITPSSTQTPLPTSTHEPVFNNDDKTDNTDTEQSTEYISENVLSGNIHHYCYDSKRNLIYFSEGEENIIKSYNPQSNVISTLWDLNKLTFNDNGGYYQKIRICNMETKVPGYDYNTSMMYDETNDRLYLKVCFDEFIDPNDYEPINKSKSVNLLYDLQTNECKDYSIRYSPLYFLNEDEYLQMYNLSIGSLTNGNKTDIYSKGSKFGNINSVIYKDGIAYGVGLKDHFFVIRLSDGELIEERVVDKMSSNTLSEDGKYFYFISKKNEIVKYDLNGKMTKLLDLNNVTNNDYRGFAGHLFICPDERYCFVGEYGIKLISKVN